jgi:hypothetical protein
VTIPDSPNDLLVNRLVVQKGGKALVVRTLIGDVHINQETMQASKRKLWRSLSTFTYPSQRLEHDLATNYAGHLTIQLHKTFRDAGYMTFTGMISMADENLMNMEFSSVTLTTNQAGYVGAIHNSVKQLWDIKQDRLALQNALNTELRDLHSNWKISTAPSEYPDKAGSTSELLMLLTAVLRSEFAIAGNIETILNSYPLSKLFIELMDSKTVDLGRVRVNAADVEEWDYVNPAADEEFDRVGGQ